MPSLIIPYLLMALASVSPQEREDSVAYSTLEELNVVAIKQDSRLREEAVSSSLIGLTEVEDLGIVDMKSASGVIPNFYIPDYGSRITSSIYVRGIGARMDQPAVGLNVDNVPYLNKDAYDFEIADIASIEMLRGPQSTLYGRNTMGGLINITTLSPMLFQGWRWMARLGTHNNYRASAGYYVKPRNDFATSVSLNFGYAGGYFTNLYNDRKLDHEIGGGLRWKSQWRVSKRLNIQNVFGTTLLRQGGYPYEYMQTGDINYNDTCFYKRFTITDGITLKYRGEGYDFNSVTAFQHIDDNMTLDQDFLPLPYFTLTQKQKESGVTEDLVLRGSKGSGKYKWLAGFFGFYKHLNMRAPVTFKDMGIKSLIEDHANSANKDYPITWDSREFGLNSDFIIPTYGVALYHESKLHVGNWTFSGGIRFDYESARLDYRSYCNTGYEIYRLSDGVFHPYSHVDIDINEKGKLHRNYFNWMPRVSVLYGFDRSVSGNVYAVVSKGYKAGGFNTQMFSEVLQERLMRMMGVGAIHDIDDIVGYRPEYSWNYEVGSHLSLLEGRLNADLSLFYIDCRDQQMTTFPDGTTTGRIMTNAGKTRSVGGEISLSGQIGGNVTLNASYGYTNARFVKYNDGKNDYKGNFIPYAPQNTLFLQVLWTINLRRSFIGLDRIMLDANMKGTGKIYWNEANTFSQKFYAQADASFALEGEKWSVRLWGENLTNTKYHTFYFMSMGNSFVQRGKPVRAGITLSLNLETKTN